MKGNTNVGGFSVFSAPFVVNAVGRARARGGWRTADRPPGTPAGSCRKKPKPVYT